MRVARIWERACGEPIRLPWRLWLLPFESDEQVGMWESALLKFDCVLDKKSFSTVEERPLLEVTDKAFKLFFEDHIDEDHVVIPRLTGQEVFDDFWPVWVRSEGDEESRAPERVNLGHSHLDLLFAIGEGPPDR
jgi:hypothetical protein